MKRLLLNSPTQAFCFTSIPGHEFNVKLNFIQETCYGYFCYTSKPAQDDSRSLQNILLAYLHDINGISIAIT